jgi:hypothetical protein
MTVGFGDWLGLLVMKFGCFALFCAESAAFFCSILVASTTRAIIGRQLFPITPPFDKGRNATDNYRRHRNGFNPTRRTFWPRDTWNHCARAHGDNKNF